VKRFALGIGLAALAQMLAFFSLGAGHGWKTPTFVSFALWVLIPLALLALRDRAKSRGLLIMILFTGLVADAVLVRGSLSEDFAMRSYLKFTGSFGWTNFALWLGLLLFWQILAARRLLGARAVDA
jgi:uncharacterized membrane protein